MDQEQAKQAWIEAGDRYKTVPEGPGKERAFDDRERAYRAWLKFSDPAMAAQYDAWDKKMEPGNALSQTIDGHVKICGRCTYHLPEGTRYADAWCDIGNALLRKKTAFYLGALDSIEPPR